MAKKIELPKTKQAAEGTKVTPDESIVLREHVVETDKMIKNKLNADGASKAFQAVRKVLEPIAKQVQKTAEQEGQFATKVLFQGTEQRACFTFTNSIQPIDGECKSLLIEALGNEVMTTLFQEQEIVGVKKSKVDELFAACKQVGIDPEEYFEQETIFAPTNEFRRTRFELRAKLDEAQNQTLDAVTEQITARPSLTVK